MSAIKLHGMCVYNILSQSEVFLYGTNMPYMAYSHHHLTFQHTTHLLLPWVAYFYAIYYKSIARLLISVWTGICEGHSSKREQISHFIFLAPLSPPHPCCVGEKFSSLLFNSHSLTSFPHPQEYFGLQCAMGPPLVSAVLHCMSVFQRSPEKKLSN